MGGGDRGGAAERVPDEQAHLAARVVHELDGPHGVGDLVREGPVAPVALGVAEAEVVEAQHADALGGQLLAHPARGGAVLAEGEAVGEDAPPADLAVGEVDDPRRVGPVLLGKLTGSPRANLVTDGDAECRHRAGVRWMPRGGHSAAAASSFSARRPRRDPS